MSLYRYHIYDNDLEMVVGHGDNLEDTIANAKFYAEPQTVGVKSGIAGGYINSQTGNPAEDNGKTLDDNGWKKS